MAPISKPKDGTCPKCGNKGLVFNDDGTGMCPSCNKAFKWRKKSHVKKPLGGTCSQCGHKGLTFNDDGTGQCPNCGRTFTWRRREAPAAAVAVQAPVAAPAPAVAPPPAQAPTIRPLRHILEKGTTYLIYEEKPDKTFTLFQNLSKQETPGLAITTIFPDKLKKNYGFEDIECRWLTETSHGDLETLNPKRLEFEIARLINNFMRDHTQSAILIEGIEYLILENGFDRVIKFIKNMNDTASAHNTTIVVPINPRSIDEKELNMLKREFDKAG